MAKGGRGVICKKNTVDDARSLDILTLQQKGVLKKSPGLLWTCSWSRDGIETGSISYRVEANESGPCAIRLLYKITDRETGEQKSLDYTIKLVSTACYFGGIRWWFICPLVINGVDCGRRCRIIYLSPGAIYFGCRECHQLSYDSRQMSGNRYYESFFRPYKMMEKAEEELAKAKTENATNKALKKIDKAQALLKQFTSKDTLIEKE